MEFPGLALSLTSLGPPGLIIGYLLWERRDLQTRLHACQEAHMADIKKFGGEITAALVTSTELIRANNVIQDKAADSAGRLVAAVNEINNTIEHLDESLKRPRR